MFIAFEKISILFNKFNNSNKKEASKIKILLNKYLYKLLPFLFLLFKWDVNKIKLIN